MFMVNLARAETTLAASQTQWPWAVRLNRTRWGDLLWQVLVECVTMTGAVFLILAAGGLAGIYSALPALNQQSREVADAEVAAIIPTWDESALFQVATPQFIDASYNGYDRYFASLRRMGTGARNEGCQGRAIVNPAVLPSLITPSFVRWFVRPPPYSNLVTAKYACEIDTAAGGRAVVAMSLRRDKDAWRVASFYVSAPKLSRN
jgi:hypothetical protein